MIFILYILVGMLTGTLATLFGLGGGFIVIPTLFLLLPLQGISSTHVMHIAIGTSLMIMLCNMVYATYLHHNHKRINTIYFKKMVGVVAAGAILGASLGNRLHGQLLKYLYISFMLYVVYKAIKREFQKNKITIAHEPSNSLTTFISFITGFLGSLLGIGGSTIIIPFVRHYNMPMVNAAALANALAIPIAVIGSFVYILSGLHITDLPAFSTGYVYWPAFFLVMLSSLVGGKIGMYLSTKLPDSKSGKSYVLLLMCLLLLMILK